MADSDMNRDNPEMDEEFEEETLTLTDEAGRTLDCYVEQTFELEGEEYVLLLPVDSPVEIFAWKSEGDDEEEAIPVEDDAEISEIFPIAKAVLEEQNLTLKRTAILLTVEGDLPEFVAEDNSDEPEDDDEYEEIQLLASFFHKDQEYEVYPMIDPFFILARMNANGQPQLLSPEEFERIEPMLPMLEDQLFDEVE